MTRRHVDPLAAVVGAAFLQRLQEDGDAILRIGSPVLAEHSPQIVRQGILLGERDVDHRQRRPLAVVHAHQEVRDDDVIDVGGIEVVEKLVAQPANGGAEVVHALRWFADW